MLHPQILLGLAASVSAIDAYFHLGNDCTGPATVCTNLNPGVCCVVNVSNSIGYRGIPTNWVIATTSYIAGGCGVATGTQTARNTNFLCFRGSFTGTRYVFSSKKRAEAGTEDPTCLETEKCTSSQKPNELVLLDGTRYNIVDLEEDVLGELVC